MGYEKLSAKLEDYLARMRAGKAHKIKPRDVEKVVAKLRARRAALVEEGAKTPEKAERLAHKLRMADDLIARSEWLLAELGRPSPRPIDADDPAL